MKEARHYKKRAHKAVRCVLCPQACVIKPGEYGFCRVRHNVGGILMAASYGRVMGFHRDPVEKKPLRHFYPGSGILSIGSHGCNFRCPWCQNAHISQQNAESLPGSCSAEDVLHTALSAAGSTSCAGRGRATAAAYKTQAQNNIPAQRHPGKPGPSARNIGVAYTYNEPTVWFEFMRDVAVLVDRAGMKNVMVTNGYINSGPLDELLDVMHAFNVDLKSFSDPFYKKYCAGQLAPVLNTMKSIIARQRHLEITFLVIPGLNEEPDRFEAMVQWIAKELGPEVPLHINRYVPAWQMERPPTPRAVLERMRKKAEHVLLHVHLGNVY